MYFEEFWLFLVANCIVILFDTEYSVNRLATLTSHNFCRLYYWPRLPIFEKHSSNVTSLSFVWRSRSCKSLDWIQISVSDSARFLIHLQLETYRLVKARGVFYTDTGSIWLFLRIFKLKGHWTSTVDRKLYRLQKVYGELNSAFLTQLQQSEQIYKPFEDLWCCLDCYSFYLWPLPFATLSGFFFRLCPNKSLNKITTCLLL